MTSDKCADKPKSADNMFIAGGKPAIKPKPAINSGDNQKTLIKGDGNDK